MSVRLPFHDRIEAGRLLGAEIAERNLPEPRIVLGLTRGGVPVAKGVAAALGAPLDVLVVRKLGVPWQPELAMGAIAGGVRTLDEHLIQELGVTENELEKIADREAAEAQRREILFRRGRHAPEVEGHTVILVDDGLATGSSMIAAIRYVDNARPARVVVAVPVGSAQACRHVKGLVSDVICLATPEPFYAVGSWYDQFAQVSDAEVQRLLEENRLHEYPTELAIS
jgi:putative phosphoribosyl transferase